MYEKGEREEIERFENENKEDIHHHKSPFENSPLFYSCDSCAYFLRNHEVCGVCGFLLYSSTVFVCPKCNKKSCVFCRESHEEKCRVNMIFFSLFESKK